MNVNYSMLGIKTKHGHPLWPGHVDMSGAPLTARDPEGAWSQVCSVLDMLGILGLRFLHVYDIYDKM